MGGCFWHITPILSRPSEEIDKYGNITAIRGDEPTPGGWQKWLTSTKPIYDFSSLANGPGSL
jgi:hypothetical protein